MVKILLQIKDNKLFFSIRKRLNTEQKNLINTNVISQNELVFSDEYIMQNVKLVHAFIKELINDYNVNTLVIKEFSIAPLILHVSSNVPKIKSLYLLEESILNYRICEKIIKTNTINYVSLYNIPTYLLEMLDKEKITVDSRNEMLFLSNFMKDNNLDKFSSIYYKTTIYLNLPFTKEDEEDFLSFISINKYLKIIHINKLNKNDIENILEVLYKHKLKNIKIYIKQNISDIELIEYLKKINKRNVKINGIQFKIDYSKDYLEDNLMNQIHINTIKTCIIIALFIISSVIFYVFYSNYTSMQKVESIQEDISNIIAEYQEEQKQNENNTNIEIENNNTTVPDNELDNEEKPVENEEPIISNDDIASLLQINEDTVGWLKVNNTNVDYPVVQANDNDYYLNKNFKKQKDNSGWIFMDYRADSVNLSQNTIIFGHNMYYSGVMFGTLYKVKRSNWYKDEENQIIEFDTLYKKMKWKIFSIYTIPKTNDYLIADFSTEEKFQSFLNLITNRSIYNFNTPVAPTDKIITLSTCSNNGKDRLVIHAVLLSDN
ncbi:MAG: class B sortase [Firmicutes bacterium]|nr:class B sortase [Bacillota bacterium]